MATEPHLAGIVLEYVVNHVALKLRDRGHLACLVVIHAASSLCSDIEAVASVLFTVVKGVHGVLAVRHIALGHVVSGDGAGPEIYAFEPRRECRNPKILTLLAECVDVVVVVVPAYGNEFSGPPVEKAQPSVLGPDPKPVLSAAAELAYGSAG